MTNQKHLEAAGQRAIAKYNRRKESEKRELAALKKMTPDSLAKKIGLVSITFGSRTYRKIQKKMFDRDRRIQALEASAL